MTAANDDHGEKLAPHYKVVKLLRHIDRWIEALVKHQRQLNVAAVSLLLLQHLQKCDGLHHIRLFFVTI